MNDGVVVPQGGVPTAPPSQPQMSVDDFDSAMNDFDQSGMEFNPPGLNQQKPHPSPAEQQPRSETPPQPTDKQDAIAEKQDEQAPPEDKSMQERAQAEAAELQAFREWKKAREESLLLPESDHDRLVNVPWGDKGKTRDVPISELKSGYMRHLDYTEKTQEAAGLRRQAQESLQNMNMFLNDLGQGGTNMRTRLEDAGFGEQLYQAAQEIYKEIFEHESFIHELRLRKVNPDYIKRQQERFDIDRKATMQARIQARQAEQWKHAATQNQQQQQQARESQAIKNALDQLRPAAFRQLSMPEDAVHQNTFTKFLIADLENNGGLNGRELRDVVMNNARAAKQFVERMTEQHLAEQAELEKAAREKGQPLSPSRMSGQAPSNGAGAPSRARMPQLGLNDFDSEMEQMNRRY